MNLIFLGPPGAGKGTQAECVCERYKLAHISTGDMLRLEMHEKTPLGVEAKRFIEAGDLVPDDVIIDMVRFRIKQLDCERGFLLDGFPRTLAQADALKAITDIDMVIYIKVDTHELIKRIVGRRLCSNCGAGYHISTYALDTCEKCGAALYIREDDAEETLKERINVYFEKTRPLIDYYDNDGILCEIEGNYTPDAVTTDINNALVGAGLVSAYSEV